MWPLVLTVAQLISVSEGLTSKEPIQLRGNVGGEAAFNCSVDPHKGQHSLIYLQRGTEFVNGYYIGKEIKKYWNNTRVDRHNNTIYMFGLNMSHAGLYTCLVSYSDTGNEIYTDIKLIVTANYSEPTVRYSKCSDKEEHCQVVCSSHGGYPRSKISWNVTGTEKPTRTPMWNILKSTEESDKDTMLFNVSSTASFNCSVMKHQNVSCSVDGVTSVFSICEVQTPKPSPVWPGVCAAAFVCLVLLAILISIPIYYCKCKKKKSSTIISSSNGIL